MEWMVIRKTDNKSENGLKIPCKYIVKGHKYILTTIQCMIKFCLG